MCYCVCIERGLFFVVNAGNRLLSANVLLQADGQLNIESARNFKDVISKAYSVDIIYSS